MTEPSAKPVHLDLQVNLLSEQKTTKLILLIEALRRNLPMVRDRCDCEAERLQQWTDPHRVLAEISDVRIACGLVYQLRIITVF